MSSNAGLIVVDGHRLAFVSWPNLELSKSTSAVGIIGWGKMGRRMGSSLISSGWSVVVTDSDTVAMSEAARSGAILSPTPADVVNQADVTFIVVSDEEQVQSVIDGESGVLSGLTGGQVVAIASSVSPELCRSYARPFTARSAFLVDTALVGGEHAADFASLVLLCGGELEVLDACQPVFSSFATAVCHVGGLGSGQVAKIVNNMVLWACLRIDYEALQLGRGLGVEPGRLRPVINAGSGANRPMQDWAYHNAGRTGDRGLRRMLDMADAAGVSLPLVEALASIMEEDQTRLEELR